VRLMHGLGPVWHQVIFDSMGVGGWSRSAGWSVAGRVCEWAMMEHSKFLLSD